MEKLDVAKKIYRCRRTSTNRRKFARLAKVTHHDKLELPFNTLFRKVDTTIDKKTNIGDIIDLYLSPLPLLGKGQI